MRAGLGDMGLPVGHFLDDEAECAHAFLFFKVVVGRFLRGKEEGIVGGARGGGAL